MARNKYPEETVQKILDAALKVFIEKGYEETSVLDIVGKMGGLTRGAFYHHFKSKEEVLFALNETLFLDINPFEAVKEHKELNGLEKIKWVIKAMHTDKEFVAMQQELEKLFTSPKIIKMQIDSIRDWMTPLMCELIEQGNADGSLNVKNPKLAAQAVFLISSFWSIEQMFPVESIEEGTQKIQMIADMCANLGLPIFDDEVERLIQEYKGIS